MTKHIFRRVYLWEWPVRIYHWVTAAAVAVLAATGLLIGAPVAFMTQHQASAGYWFGTVRFLHFTAAWVFAVMFALLAAGASIAYLINQPLILSELGSGAAHGRSSSFPST